ncbi:hypothetical protein IWQ60_002248 [Tieghemiomyces parasiticus]|uniref:Eukaryotic translation initiation factor 3 subunit M n=1 Tax=Tieghemiomyces parasiticus TaxID=78921 RepID=A0A9W8E176_9FUNG|nr:hypothetical protein IWQ60_002248 [Tieghemiomyces parasiticus]
MENINTVFVDGPLTQQAEELALHCAKQSGSEQPEESTLVKKLHALDPETPADELVALLMPELSALSATPAKEYEAAYNQLFFIVKSAAPATIAKSLSALMNEITTGAAEVPVALRLKVLSNLFNLLPAQSPLRADIFLAVVRLAARSDLSQAVVPQLAKLDLWAKEWQLTPAQVTQLYLEISRSLSADQLSPDALTFLVKALRSSQDDPTYTTGSLKAEAARAVGATLQNPDLYNFDQLASLTPIRDLKGEPIYELLSIFLQDALPRLQEYLAANAAAVAEYQLDPEVLLSKMRHLSLAALAGRHIGRQLAYADIASVLAVPEDEVELWVIDAIRVGLVQAKMDQMSRTILVNRTTYRSFGQEEWAAIQSQLTTWDQSLTETLQVIGNAKLLAQQQAPRPSASVNTATSTTSATPAAGAQTTAS